MLIPHMVAKVSIVRHKMPVYKAIPFLRFGKYAYPAAYGYCDCALPRHVGTTVRKISGHAPSSKEFYRYVLWAQAYQDKETESRFSRLQEKTLERRA